ncbi:MAG: D-tyrosyl-tRNA(Tyr) deacylase [Paramuribaculum sp.]|nr:D-tyrosyl-tRNA(Tyr) deacylase [Paramuribaculum sp.]
MKIVIQRCSRASVSVDNKIISEIGAGMMVLGGVAVDDTDDDAIKLAAKTAALRIFNDSDNVMNLSVIQTEGEILAVSQFTLLASTRRGNRPSYVNAARHELATRLYDLYCDQLALLIGRPVKKGIFGADMQVELINDGPVTIVIDTAESR